MTKPELTARERDQRDRARFHGLDIIDATEPYECSVLSLDIRSGDPGTRCNCALARASLRDPVVLMSSINPRDAWLVFADDPQTIVRYMLDARTRKALETFDDEKMQVELVAAWAHGTTFTLHPPKGSMTRGYYRPSRADRKPSGATGRSRASSTR